MLQVSKHLGSWLVVAGIFILPAHATLIPDGGFEAAAQNIYSDTIGDGWNVLSGTIEILGSSAGYGLAHGGDHYADLDYSDSVNSLSQTLATTIGQSYTVSFWLGDDVGGDAVTVNFGDSTLLSANTAAGSGFSTSYNFNLFSYNVVATSASTDLTITSNYTSPGGGIGAVLDDVSVEPSAVPEPTTLFSLITGLPLVVLFRRRNLNL